MTTRDDLNGRGPREYDRARVTRPALSRAEPRRNIFNAFRQDDGRGAEAFLHPLDDGLDVVFSNLSHATFSLSPKGASR